MKIKLLFAWYDFWVGFFWDKRKKWLYIFPIPMCGIIFKFKKKSSMNIDESYQKTLFSLKRMKGILSFKADFKNEAKIVRLDNSITKIGSNILAVKFEKGDKDFEINIHGNGLVYSNDESEAPFPPLIRLPEGKWKILNSVAFLTKKDLAELLPNTFEGRRWSRFTDMLEVRDITISQYTTTIILIRENEN